MILLKNYGGVYFLTLLFLNLRKSMTVKNPSLSGIFFGLVAGALWGFPFLVPQLLSNYSAFDITVGRFVFFGCISLLEIRALLRIWSVLTRNEKITWLMLSAGGFWFYTLVLFFGVQSTGGILSSLVLGLLPLSISIFGSKRHELDRQNIIGLLLICVGILCTTLGSPANDLAGVPSHTPLFWKGVAALFFCLLLWSWYAIRSSRLLQSMPQVSSRMFSSAMGVLSLLFLLPPILRNDKWQLFTFDHPEFLLWSMVLGLGSSWLANWFWNLCSKSCPPRVFGPLMVSEAIFALLYTYLYWQRGPSGLETLGIAAYGFGVFVALKPRKLTQ